jgi:hypothetical protein
MNSGPPQLGEREREIWNTSVPLIHPTLELDPIVLVADSSPI